MTADEQVEKVAKALFAWDIQEHGEPRPTWEGSEGLREVFRSGAAVAIAAMQPQPVTVQHGPVSSWRNLDGPWHESNKCKCGLRWPHPTPTPQADVLAEIRELHSPSERSSGLACSECSAEMDVPHPCETILIIDEHGAKS